MLALVVLLSTAGVAGWLVLGARRDAGLRRRRDETGRQAALLRILSAELPPDISTIDRLAERTTESIAVWVSNAAS